MKRGFLLIQDSPKSFFSLLKKILNTDVVLEATFKFKERLLVSIAWGLSTSSFLLERFMGGPMSFNRTDSEHLNTY